MAVASGRGSELERGFAFGVVRQLLEPWVIGAHQMEHGELFSGTAALARPLFELSSTSEGSAAERSFEILHGLYWLCANLSRSRPLLLAVDDAHWVDTESLRFLAYLAQRLEGLPIAVLIATRPAESVTDDALTGLMADPQTIAISPPPLTHSATASLLADGLGREPDPAFVDACVRATGGTPFLLRELIREIGERELDPIADSAASIDHLGPRTVVRSVSTRVQRLSAEAASIARVVAVLDADAAVPRLARAAGVTQEQVALVLDDLAAAGIISPGRPIEFVHPIVRSAVYQEIPTGERSRLHALAAELLRNEGFPADRIAGHLLVSDPCGDPESVEVLRDAARTALTRGADVHAVSYLERALQEPPDPTARPEVLAELGRAEILAGRTAAASVHFDEAQRATADPSLRFSMARERAAALSLLARFPEAMRIIEDLVDEADDFDSELVLRADLMIMSALGPPRDGERRHVEDLDEKLGTSPAARNYLAAKTLVTGIRGGPAAKVSELGRRALDAGVVSELRSGAIAWSQVAHMLIVSGDFEGAERLVNEAFEELDRHPSVIGSIRANLARSTLNLRRGALREAVAHARTAVDMGRATVFSGWINGLAVLVEALFELGEVTEADDALVECGLSGDIPDGFAPNNVLLEARGKLRVVQRRIEEAAADFEELERRNDARDISVPAIFDHLTGLALVALARDDRERAAKYGTEQLERSKRWGAPREVGVAKRTLGLCTDRSIELFRESVSLLEGSGARLEYARSLIELGAAIRRSGKRTEARESLHAGMEIAHRCGARPLVERAREELLAAGARPRRFARTGVDALTPSELRVARMAAEGLTNRQIAQELFVTERTVEGHLTHAFAKLGISTRGELPEHLST